MIRRSTSYTRSPRNREQGELGRERPERNLFLFLFSPFARVVHVLPLVLLRVLVASCRAET